MRDEYDFSKAERGKFYQPNAIHHLPVYLDQDISKYLTERAQAKGTTLNHLVNELLRDDITLVEKIK